MTATPPLSLERMRLDAVLEGLMGGDTAALARAISMVENQRAGFEQVLSALHGRIGKRSTQRIGITGPPGAGKSTITEQLVRAYRARGLKIAVSRSTKVCGISMRLLGPNTGTEFFTS